jgi:hypothetical protein
MTVQWPPTPALRGGFSLVTISYARELGVFSSFRGPEPAQIDPDSDPDSDFDGRQRRVSLR